MASSGRAAGSSPGSDPGSSSGITPGKPDANAVPADLVEVGRVVDAYGIRGWVKLAPFNDPRESVLRGCRRWWLPDGSSLRVIASRVHGASIVAHPEGFSDRDAAERLRGLTIRVSRADFPPSEHGEYYWIDLVGCAVVNPRGVELGVVRKVEDHGAHPILLLETPDGQDAMIPFVAAWIVEVEIAARRIVADWEPDY
jgi:16S rRNA processing protein RimM